MKNQQADRRYFLKSTAMAAATALATGVAKSSSTPPGGDALPVLQDVEWNKAPCRFCGTGCHVQVGVKDGKVVAITGDRKADVNKGLLCVKGYHVGMILYGEDRLTQPQLRVNGKLEPISWNKAIQIISDRIRKAPEKFAIYGSGQWTIPEGYVANKFIKAGIANNMIDPNARLCMASAVTGYIGTYGVDEPYNGFSDLDHADCVILWGNNLSEMHPILFSRYMDRKIRGDKISLVDMTTRWTRTSQMADHVLMMQPQSDMAIANCIANQLIANKTYSREFVEKYCNFRGPEGPASLKGVPITFDEYKSLVAEYTPEKVSKLSGLSVEELVWLGELFGNPDIKITSLWCMGMNQHTQGTAINNLVHAVHLLSGHWGKPGDGPQSLTGQPSACGTVREVGTLAHALPGGLLVAKPEHTAKAEKLWNLPPGRINPKPGYHAVKMWEKFCSPSAEKDSLDTIWVQVTNPGQTLPNLHKLFDEKEKQKDKFLIVSDVYPTATTRLADLILPSAMWVEKNGVFGNSERRTQQWFKMVQPPGEARDDCWQTLAVAHRLFLDGFEGMKKKDGSFLFHFEDQKGKAVPVWDWERYYDYNVDELLFEEYRQFTEIKHKHVAPYQELVKARGMRWPVTQDKHGVWKDTAYRFVEGSDPFVEQGKKFQFYHSTTGDDRAMIFFRPYVPPPEVPDDEYPFWLDTGRVLEHWHTGTMTMRVPPLRKAMPSAYVEVNKDDAQKLGIRTGDRVKLETRRGVLELNAWIDGRGSCPAGHLFVPFFDEKRLINQLTLEAYCPISKQPDYKKCAVRISKVG